MSPHLTTQACNISIETPLRYLTSCTAERRRYSHMPPEVVTLTMMVVVVMIVFNGGGGSDDANHDVHDHDD